MATYWDLIKTHGGSEPKFMWKTPDQSTWEIFPCKITNMILEHSYGAEPEITFSGRMPCEPEQIQPHDEAFTVKIEDNWTISPDEAIKSNAIFCEELPSCMRLDYNKAVTVGETTTITSSTPTIDDVYKAMDELEARVEKNAEEFAKNIVKENRKMMSLREADIEIKKIDVVKPNKVMIVTIGQANLDSCVDPTSATIYKAFFSSTYHEREIKVVVKEPDVFDMRRGLFIAIAKYLYSDVYTVAGIEHVADEMQMMKHYVKMVDKAIKNYNREQREAEKAARLEAERQAIVERRRKKNNEHKARRKKKSDMAKLLQELIDSCTKSED